MQKKEHVGNKYQDEDTGKIKRGRIDVVYYYKNIPLLALEIDSGLKKTSIKKLVANPQFKYRIWFCYKKKLDTNKYKQTIKKYDINEELIYLLSED